MRRTVKQIARASGVSVRMLHHYDQIGLLQPAEIGPNGYRHYGRAELLRLQQILFYRDLGLPLREIAPILDQPGFDLASALLSHRERLGDEINRNQRLIRTIDQTVASLQQEKTMTDKEFFEGFSPEKQARWEAELATRSGEAAAGPLADAKRRIGAMSPDERRGMIVEMERLHAALADLLDRRVDPASAEAQALTEQHHAWVCRSWTPDRESYAGLGRLYVEHPDFRATFDAVRPGLHCYLARAMARFAEDRLQEAQT
jgi:DNA-binding transcriptional MerR regulator